MAIYLARALLPLAMLGTLAACADRPLPLDPQAPENDPGPAALQSLSCTADVRAGTVFCDPGTGPSGEGSRLITGGQDVYVRMASSNLAYAGGVFTFDATVQNLIPQTLGMGTDGEPDGNGVSVVFWQEPVATEGTGDITIKDALTGMFTRSGERYYRYDQTLAQNQTSDPRQWSFTVPATVVRFGFSVYVAASVQYPDGWVEITGAPDLRVARGSTLPLVAVVRDARGRDITASAGPITWSVADSSVAILSGSTVRAAATAGYTTVAARVGTREGNALLLVGHPFIQITGGGDHTCGLDPVGQVYCWGANRQGQLGDSSTIDSYTPVAVQQGGIRFVEVSARERHTCGLSSTGQAFCWGSNYEGALGDGTMMDRHTPVAVRQGSSVYVKIAAGGYHNCGLSAAGRAQCWGNNLYGMLGDGTNALRRTSAVDVLQGPGTYVSLVAGEFHTCARGAAGDTHCWGANREGQIGDGTSTERHTPVAVDQGAIPYVEITGGTSHTCGLSMAGQTYCWGSNDWGQIGDTSFTKRHTPTAVQQGASAYVMVAGARAHTCSLTAAGQAYCWGLNYHGELGSGQFDERIPFPVAVHQGSTRYVEIAAGRHHSCGRTRVGQVYCWGSNSAGQLGDSTIVTRKTPVAVR